MEVIRVKNSLDTDVIRRSYEFKDIRALGLNDEDDKVKRLEGHPAVFNSSTSIGGWYDEIIERGAFDGCDFTDVPFFVNHDTSKIPLARSRRNNSNSTMELKIDNVGLYMRADIDTENNQEARQLYSSIQRGDITGMSFCFRVKEQKWENLDTPTPTRRIIKISKVYEVSAVNDPAYEDTDINARDKVALDNAKLTLDNVRTQELDNSEALEIEKLKFQILMKG